MGILNKWHRSQTILCNFTSSINFLYNVLCGPLTYVHHMYAGRVNLILFFCVQFYKHVLALSYWHKSEQWGKKKFVFYSSSLSTPKITLPLFQPHMVYSSCSIHLVPVSYTHLDVYKRQVFMCVWSIQTTSSHQTCYVLNLESPPWSR